MDSILTAYVNSRFFREIIARYRPLAVFMTGSRAAGLQHATSDYDICLLVDVHGKPDASYPGITPQCIHKATGACLHYCTNGLDELFINDGAGRTINPRDTYIWKAMLEFGLEPEPLYIRKGFAPLWEKLYANKELLAKAGLYELYMTYGVNKDLIDIAKEGTMLPNRIMAYCMMEYHILKDLPPTEEQLRRYTEIHAMTDPAEVDSLADGEKQLYIDALVETGRMFEEDKATYEGYKRKAGKLYAEIRSALS